MATAAPTKPRKVIFKKTKINLVDEPVSKEVKDSGDSKDGKENKSSDTTFVLSDLNVSLLDRNYVLPEIAKRQSDRKTAPMFIDDDDAKGLSTSLEKLGISTARKEPLETICWGDRYKVQLFVNNGIKQYELTPDVKTRCTWCHQYPPDGALMLAVPYKFVSSYVHEHVYAPECVNVVPGIRVEPSKSTATDKGKKTDSKTAPKINYFRRDITPTDQSLYDAEDSRVVYKDYFETDKPVCGFNCMVAKGRELAEKDPRFRTVKMHITHMYYLIFGSMPEKLIPAPPYDVLQEYGGEYTVEEYRKSFKFVSLDETNQYYTRAKEVMNPNIMLFATVQDDS
jgi:hypothetical protein